jgi:hypothetical protein
MMSSNELNLESEANPRVTAWLAEAYAPPKGDLYWPELEQKIMDSVRVNAGRTSYKWRKLALIAAGLLLAAGASIYAHTHATQIKMAYEALVHPDRPANEPLGVEGVEIEGGVLTNRPGESHRDAKFKDVIKP